MSLQSLLTHCKFRFEKKLFLSLVSADEEEEHLRQIEELKEGRAKKDAELTQLRSDLAQIRETGQVSQVDVGRGRTTSCRSVPFRSGDAIHLRNAINFKSLVKGRVHCTWITQQGLMVNSRSYP